MTRIAVAPRPRLSFVMWDGTEAVDSVVLARGLHSRFGFRNLLDLPGADLTHVTGNARRPRVFQPAGPEGFDHEHDPTFERRGMFEYPADFARGPQHGTGQYPHFVAYSGHGMPGFMFANSELLMVSSRPMQSRAPTWVASRGQWSFDASARWSNPNTKVVLLSACRQLQGRPEVFRWTERMRGSDPLHVILAYHQTAPAAGVSAGVNRRFLEQLANGRSFVEAWKRAHPSANLSARWAALCYADSVGDTMREWVRTGTFASRPDPVNGQILYFDSDTPNGVAVTERAPVFDCWVTPPGTSERVPGWYIIRGAARAELHIQLLEAGQRFETGDVLSVFLTQVRHDYGGPFSIDTVFAFLQDPGLRRAGSLRTSRRVHDDYYGNDCYELTLPASIPAPMRLSSDRRTLTIPIVFSSTNPNDHLPIFYFQVALKGPSKALGLLANVVQADALDANHERRIIHDHQFGHFRFDAPVRP